MTQNATAVVLRSFIENVLNFAIVKKHFEGLNPARWRGHLDQLLSPPGKVAPVEHHAALPYEQIAIFMGQLRDHEGLPPRALELVILTAARTSEVLQAKWDEIDLMGEVWRIPQSRMKAGKGQLCP